MARVTSRVAMALLLAGLGVGLPAAQAALVAVERDSGRLYTLDTTTAALTLLSETGSITWADLAFAPDGALYSVSIGSSPNLFRIDALSGQSALIGALGDVAVGEGGLAVSPGGQAWVVSVLQGSQGLDPWLYSLDLGTGAATPVGQMGTFGNLDINGIGWRSDGQLLGLERVSNSLVTIDPATAVVSPLAVVPATVGGVGGLTLEGGFGYYVTSGPGGSSPGSNQLYRFDPFSGASTLVGSLAPTVAGVGLSGIAAEVPEPAAGLLWLAGGALLAVASRRRLRQRP